ncbi:hypothetical protein DPMN_137577 [Dreissena polymorpha]|uniref:Uncharacterized protein n=1 Tax=Dreissena polymorpha TaxID=45954 RepID=A0A9D4G5I6_DREPO|nr:hypothetical protein DPMN_137577 [Dreissena polymorpha]
MVPLEHLAAKLKHNGINENILIWIRSFISNRSQQVQVEGVHSNPSPVASGVLKAQF